MTKELWIAPIPAPGRTLFNHHPHQDTGAAAAGFVCYLNDHGLQPPQLIQEGPRRRGDSEQHLAWHPELQ